MQKPLPLHTQATCFVDAAGRQVILRGLNLGGDSKVPFPDGGTQHPTAFADHRSVSFVGRPFPLEEADSHLARMRSWGFNCLRLLTTWEAVEHAGPGQYDTEYLDYFAGICQKAGEHGFYVLVDFHQDVWSRMSGGDGAPGWTWDAVGLDFQRFDAAGAAHVMQHRFNYEPSADDTQATYPAMSWAQNYRMPANAILWTLFWGSRHIVPDFLIEGIPASDYLQNHLLGAMAQVAQRVSGMAHVIGFDSLNEPGIGWLGQPLSPARGTDGQRLIGGLPMPGVVWSPLDALVVAAGVPVDLPVRDAGFNPAAQVNVQTVNPQGIRIWKDGVACPFAEAGVYHLEATGGGVEQGATHSVQALKENAFTRFEGRLLDVSSDIFGPFYHRVAQTVRAAMPQALLFAEMDPLGAMSGRLFPSAMPVQSVNASHWYDVTLLARKQFDAALSVDLLTGERSVGAAAIGARYQRQLAGVQDLSRAVQGGPLPTLVGEFGIPYDLDHGASYAAWARGERDEGALWKAHTLALSLMYDALDALHASSTQWNYTAGNRNNARIGDQWNQEDLSVYSLDQPQGRAVLGFCRPYAQAVQGRLQRVCFDTASGVFELRYEASADIAQPTQIFLPALQYGQGVSIVCDGPVLRYTHDASNQMLRVWAAEAGVISVVCQRQA